jgi:hypothetical protein
MPTASANPLPLRLLPLKLSEPPTLFDVAVAVSCTLSTLRSRPMVATTFWPSATAPVRMASRPVLSDSVPPAVTLLFAWVVSVEVPEDLLALTPTLALAVTPPTTATPTVTPRLAPEEEDFKEVKKPQKSQEVHTESTLRAEVVSAICLAPYLACDVIRLSPKATKATDSEVCLSPLSL